MKSRNGQLLGIDLYLSECVERIEGEMGFKRLLPKILSPFGLVFDCIITTHPHFDHFDMDAVPELMSNKKTYLYASRECEREVRRLRMSNNERIIYVQPDDRYINGDYELDFVFCDHGSAAPDAVGVIITVDGKKIYMTGDTAFSPESVKGVMGKGPFDIMIGPINGAYGNMNEQDFTEFSNALKPGLTIPCHYGMFAAHGGDPGLFIKTFREKCPANKYYLMALGEGIII